VASASRPLPAAQSLIPEPADDGGMMPTQEMEQVVVQYYGEESVTAIIGIKVDTKEADRIAQQVSEFDTIQDVFLVTGDMDIIAKARFPNYRGLKDFVLSSLAPIQGIKDTKTLMVVTTYKEAGLRRDIG
jgi:DNA-binding Lrp family transcriptional regulator